MPKRIDSGYSVDVRPLGRNGPRYRKTFKTLSEANAYERYVRSKHDTTKPWEPEKRDNRLLSDLSKRWYELHGINLKTGEKRKQEIDKVIRLLGDPVAQSLTPKQFSNMRSKRLLTKKERSDKTISKNTVNHDLANFRALFNELERLGEINYSNPLKSIRKIKADDKELRYLTKSEISQLLDALDEHQESHARISARVCLSTGTRWGESCNISPHQITNGLLTLSETKSGKSRSVPISKSLEKLILDHAPLIDGMSTFKRTVSRIGLHLPAGQMTHVLRHTFASWFMINGGDIITLRDALGHSDITLTMRYAHLAPNHLERVLNLNPLA